MAKRQKEEHQEPQTPTFKPVKPRTPGQKDYIEAIENSTISLCYGPPGAGKSFIPCALAVQYLLEHKVRRLVFTRPAIECGERLGFLPGSQDDKIAPYLRPIFDSLLKYLTKQQIEKLKHDGAIEFVPLGLLRGTTLDHAFIVGDEMQNATLMQLKMLITRLGEGSKMVLSGDIMQSDLPYYATAGHTPFEKVIDALEFTKDIGVVELTEEDIVRHKLLREIAPKLDKLV